MGLVHIHKEYVVCVMCVCVCVFAGGNVMVCTCLCTVCLMHMQANDLLRRPRCFYKCMCVLFYCLVFFFLCMWNVFC